MLCDKKIIREYDYDNKQKKTGEDTIRYRTLSWYPFDRGFSKRKKKYSISTYQDELKIDN